MGVNIEPEFDPYTTPYEQHEEQTLLQMAQAGDYLAFDELHQRLEAPITRFVRRLVGQLQAAEDIVQDTFLALYVNLSKVKPDENVRPYVYRIARNRCYDLLRRQGRYEYLSLDDDTPTTVRISFDLAEQQGETPPDEVAHWLLLYLEVQEAMENLPELQRQALILHSEEHMTYAEIAEVMDVSVGTVKSRLHQAKKRLKALLRPETMAAINYEFYEDDAPAQPTSVGRSEDVEAPDHEPELLSSSYRRSRPSNAPETTSGQAAPTAWESSDRLTADTTTRVVTGSSPGEAAPGSNTTQASLSASEAHPTAGLRYNG